MSSADARGLAVVDAGRLVGMFTVSDVLRAQHAGLRSVAEAMTTKLQVAYPDESLHAALLRMTSARVSRLPVVEPGKSWHLLGMINVRDIAEALELELAEMAESARTKIAAVESGVAAL